MRAWLEHQLEDRSAEVARTMELMVKYDYRHRELKFVPHASTWINKGFYDDEVEDVDEKKSIEMKKDKEKAACLLRDIKSRRDRAKLTLRWADDYTDDELLDMYKQFTAKNGIRFPVAKIRTSAMIRDFIYSHFVEEKKG